MHWDWVTHPGFPKGGHQRQAWAEGLVRFDGESVNSSSQRPGMNCEHIVSLRREWLLFEGKGEDPGAARRGN